jgi:hypothetical protein
MNSRDRQITLETRARYDRNARFYDLITRGSERMLEPGRAELWRA